MKAAPGAARARWPCLPLAVLVAALLIWPGFGLVEQSVRAGEGGAGLTASHYARIALQPRLLRALLASIGLSAGVAVASTLLCMAPAWLLVRASFPGKPLLRAIYALPLSFSGVIVGFLMVATLGRAGFVPTLAERFTGVAWFSSTAYQLAGIALAYLYFEIPRALLTLEAAFRRLDWRLASAARSLGASPGQAFLHVLLPALLPALISTTALTFSVSLGSFGVVLILATRQWSVLPLEIFMAYLAFPSDRHAAAAMSVVLVGLALAVNYSARVALERAQGPSEAELRRGPALAHS